MYRALFLDRDGVLLRAPAGHYNNSVEDAEFEIGAIQAMAKLSKRFQKLVVITNAGAGIRGGHTTHAAVSRLHEKMHEEIQAGGGRLDGFYMCRHPVGSLCDCQKPGTHLFKEAIKQHEIDVEGSYMIGDHLSDLEAGAKVGLRTILVRTGRGAQSLHALRSDPVKYAMIWKSNPLVADSLYFYAFEISVRYLASYAPQT